MNIGIYGSCVSRDTAEFIAKSNVLVYVARQSVVSLVFPHGDETMNLSNLKSPFQKKMVRGDLLGDGALRLVKQAEEIDIVLVDLVDERRGFWRFPDGSTLTNSIEVELSGVTEKAEKDGAKLVRFGTDEHFHYWKRCYNSFVDKLESFGLLKKTILIDVEWARATDDNVFPASGTTAKLLRQLRHARRGLRRAGADIANRRGVGTAWLSLTRVRNTPSEDLADRSERANRDYIRYRKVARSRIEKVVSRSSNEVRTSSLHKWGPEPYHYRDSDYVSLAKEIVGLKVAMDYHK